MRKDEGIDEVFASSCMKNPLLEKPARSGARRILGAFQIHRKNHFDFSLCGTPVVIRFAQNPGECDWTLPLSPSLAGPNLPES